LKKEALGSGEVAIAKSPIPPARASGEIRKNGTAVVTTLILLEPWATKEETPHSMMATIAVNFKAVDFIESVYKCKKRFGLSEQLSTFLYLEDC
jgi:hypothetical protein